MVLSGLVDWADQVFADRRSQIEKRLFDKLRVGGAKTGAGRSALLMRHAVRQ